MSSKLMEWGRDSLQIRSTRRRHLSMSGLLLASVSTALMLQSLRVFASYLFFGSSNPLTQAAVALGVVLAVALVAPLARCLGYRRLVLLSVAGLGACRLALQFLELPSARLALSAGAVLCWGWLAVALLSVHRETVSLGTVGGLGLDLALRVALGTLDLPWMPGLAAHTVTLGLLAALIAAASRTDLRKSELHEAGSPALLAVGPALALHHILGGNLGLAQVKLGFPLPSAAAVLALGVALGAIVSGILITGGSEIVGRSAARRQAKAAVVILGALGSWLYWRSDALAALGLVIASAVIIVQLTIVLVGTGTSRKGLGVTALLFAIAMATEVALLFAYYGLSGSGGVVALSVVALSLGVIGAGVRQAEVWPYRGGALAFPAMVGVLLVAACCWQWLSWSAVRAEPPAGRELTVMTYNIQSGFGADGRFSLERTARAIGAQAPDVVVLQEVGRGWLTMTGMDQALWLSRRLGMPYAWGSNSDDGLWGNAILSRLPITETVRLRYAQNTNRERGAVGARLETQAGPIWVYGTHLAAPREADAVRLSQARQLLDAAGGRAPTLILADLNADPDDDTLVALRRSGFLDPGRSLGSSAYTSRDRRRIDYILATEDVEIIGIRVPAVRASDHRPVVARVRIDR